MTKLLLKTVSAEFAAHGGFQYPREVGATVTAPDWNDRAECGGGLHGLLWGEGDPHLISWDDDAVALVLAAEDDTPMVDLKGKVKVPSATIAYIGKLRDAANYIIANGGAGKRVHGGTSTSGDGGTSTSGYGGTSTSGDGGTSTSGNRGTSTSGEEGVIIILRWNGKRYKPVVGNIGEDGLKPNTKYKLNAKGQFVEA